MAGGIAGAGTMPTPTAEGDHMDAGILAIWNDCAPAGRDAYERWYLEEHLPERVGLPGFRAGRRYERIEGDREYFTFYETETPEALASPAYLERLANPTPLTTSVMPHFARMSRTACRRRAHLGRMIGGIALTVAIGSPPDAAGALEGGDLRALLQEPGVCSAQLWSAVPALATGSTPESTLRGGKDETVAAVLLVETSRIDEARQAREGRALAAVLGRLGGARRVETGIYRLLCLLEQGALAGSSA
jgi:hypothetical protein